MPTVNFLTISLVVEDSDFIITSRNYCALTLDLLSDIHSLNYIPYIYLPPICTTCSMTTKVQIE